MATKTFKYRLYPSKSQRVAMRETLDACRWVYNKVLEVRKEAWEERGETLSLYDTINMLPKWKAERPWLKWTYSQVLQDVCVRVDKAYNAFFRRVKAGEKPGFPRFKGDWYKSFTYPQNGFRPRGGTNRLYLAKIGEVKTVVHRQVMGKKVKRLTIKCDKLGNWFACFVVEFKPEALPLTSNIVGIDMGCEYLATLSTGEHIDNPRFLRKDEKVLAKARRNLSKSKKGTTEYKKRVRVVQHIHRRISNRRKDFAHKLSRRLVNEFQFIVFEDLDIQAMQSKGWHSLNKSIDDAAWGQLIGMTQYKAEWAGRTVVKVDPRNTSQMCSGCGELVPKLLSERVHSCPHCGLNLDRDTNAALNILARGLACMGSIPRRSSY